jgi:DNA-binding beta-propeller fold protein YncE
MLVLLVVVSGTLSATPLPLVHACSICNFLLTWGSLGTGNGQFHYTRGVAVDRSGNVYVTDQGNSRVEKFTSTGIYITQLSGSSPNQLSYPSGVAVDASGNVYVTDTGNNRVEKFTSTGTFITNWGSSGSGNSEFASPGPYGVAVDNSGNVYVVDRGNNRIEKFSSTGTFTTTWGHSGNQNGNFTNPYGVAVDSSGNVYVTDTGNNRVEKFTSTGAFILAWGSTGSGNGEFDVPVYVASDPYGNVYVADYSNGRVQKFTGTGTYLSQWGSPGSGNGEFNGPYGVAADSFGNVYVTDQDNDRVELFGDTTLASIPLVEGWNLISLPIVPVSTAIAKVLNDLIVGNNFTIVWSYQSGKWSSASFSNGKVSGSLTTMQDGFGYWIYMTQPSNLKVLGYVVPPVSSPPTYSLSAGWNLIGYKPEPDPTATETVSTYLTSITGSYDSNNVWVYTSGSWARNPTSLTPGEGMWILVTSSATLRP